MAILQKLAREEDVTITSEEPTGLIIYQNVKSDYKFIYAGEEFFMTLTKDGYNATHKVTGRGVISSKDSKPSKVQEAFSKALKVLDANCDRFDIIFKFTPVPEHNLALDLTLKNLL